MELSEKSCVNSVRSRKRKRNSATGSPLFYELCSFLSKLNSLCFVGMYEVVFLVS